MHTITDRIAEAIPQLMDFHKGNGMPLHCHRIVSIPVTKELSDGERLQKYAERHFLEYHWGNDEIQCAVFGPNPMDDAKAYRISAQMWEIDREASTPEHLVREAAGFITLAEGRTMPETLDRAIAKLKAADCWTDLGEELELTKQQFKMQMIKAKERTET